MSDFPSTEPAEPRSSDIDHSGNEAKPLSELVLDFMTIVARRRKFIVWFVLICSLLAAGIAAVSPKWYKSTSSVFPAEQTSFSSGLESLSALARSFGGVRLGAGQHSDLERYMAILNSESVLLRVIERFDLTRVYEIVRYPREKTIKALLSNTEFDYTDEGGIMISVYDTDPQRAADMANYFVEVLNETNTRMLAQNAKANREFIGQRVDSGRVDLRRAENALRQFQEESGMMINPDAGSSGVPAVAELYLMKERKEVEIGILERMVDPDNPSLRNARLELSEIKRKVDKLPEVGVGSLRLYRDVYIQQKIMEFLIPLYEQAKVEEQRATPSVIVLDHAKVAERKAKPKISMYGLLAFVVSSILALLAVFILEGYNRLKRLQPGRLNEIVALARSDWFGLRLRRKRKSES